MSHFPHHKPALWELFRNEPVESQKRRVAIKKSHELANEIRKRDTGLWWDAQKHVDQVVPAEFVTPNEIDTSTYRYQVFARPPPIQCPGSLKDISDEPLPIRYNVKRVAMDKPFPPAEFECAGHWSKHPFILQRHQGRGGGRCDFSRNNNTQPSFSQLPCLRNTLQPIRGVESKTVVYGASTGAWTLGQNRSFTSVHGKARPKTSKSRNSVASKTEPFSCTKQESFPADNNNSQATGLCELNIPDQNQGTKTRVMSAIQPRGSEVRDESARSFGGWSQSQEDATESHPVNFWTHPPSNGLDKPKSPSRNTEKASIACRPLQYISAKNSQSHDQSECHRRLMSAGSSRSHLRHNCTPRSVRSGVCSRNLSPVGDSNNSPQANVDVARNKSSLNLSGLTRPKSSRSNCSIQSETSSVCSSVSLSSSRSLNKISARKARVQHQLPPPGPKRQDNQSDVGALRPSQSRESVGSLMSNDSHAGKAMRGSSRRKFLTPPLCKDQESVASLLSDSNQSNNRGASTNSTFHCTQDVFGDIILPALTRGGKIMDRSIAFCLNNVCLDNLAKDVYPATLKVGDGLLIQVTSSPQCTNNNALTRPDNEPGTYILQCRPIRPCGTLEGQVLCDQSSRKMLCQCHGKQLNIPLGQSIHLDQVRPIDPKSGKIKDKEEPQRFECRALTSCSTGKQVMGPDGPLMVCQAVKPKTPEIGYGTYKIVGSVQRRAKPDPDFWKDLSLPPDLEEYREFSRRCPNFQTDRYDRSHPLNEMLLPSNKATTLLGGHHLGPYTFCKMPKRKLPPLFEPLKTRSDLTWSLPAFVVNK